LPGICAQCGGQLAEGARYCSQCGAQAKELPLPRNVPPEGANRGLSDPPPRVTISQAKPMPSGPRANIPVIYWLVLITILFGIAGGVWYLRMKDRQLASVLEPPSPSAPSIPSPPPPPPKPRLSEPERRSVEEALLALKGLQSVTTAGVNYTEYSRRVLDTKVQVDRFLDTSGGDPELRQSIREAMDLYLLASDAWNAKVMKEYTRVAEDPRVNLCPQAKADRDDTMGNQYVSRQEARGIAVSVSSPTFWQCASERIAVANQRLKG
jgi:hypothetical protein